MKSRRNLSLPAGLVIVSLALLISLLSIIWTPCDPQVMDLQSRFAGPSARHLLGCDHFGRDILSRIMSATATALGSGLLSVTLGALCGIAVGLAAALAPRFASFLMMRLVDALMAFPTILVALTLAAVIGKGLFPSVAAVCLAMIPSFSRMTYTMILEGRNALYIRAAQSYGANVFRIAFFHLLPSLMTRLVTQFTSSVGSAILLESSLSFLGLGIQPPDASLGMMLSEARSYALTQPWQAVPAGLVLLILVLGFNLLGDGLNELIQSDKGARHV